MQFLRAFASQYGRNVQGISPAAMRILEQHDWPGNVRELEHAIERAVILSRDTEIKPSDLPEFGRARDIKVGQQRHPSRLHARGGGAARHSPDARADRLEQAGNGRHPGHSSPTLYNKLRKYRLWRSEDRFPSRWQHRGRRTCRRRCVAEATFGSAWPTPCTLCNGSRRRVRLCRADAPSVVISKWVGGSMSISRMTRTGLWTGGLVLSASIALAQRRRSPRHPSQTPSTETPSSQTPSSSAADD